MLLTRSQDKDECDAQQRNEMVYTFFFTKSNKSGVCFILISKLDLDSPHFKCLTATRGWWTAPDRHREVPDTRILTLGPVSPSEAG